MSLYDLIKPRVCELGKIKIGGLGDERTARNGNKWRPPVKHDHFTVTTLTRDAKGDLIPDTALMTAMAGFADPDGKLRQLPISLLSNDVEDILQAAYVWYGGKRLAAKSDGKTLTWHCDPNPRVGWLKEPRTEPWKPHHADMTGPDGKKLFKLHVCFNCVIAAAAARWGGVYKFRSTSQISAEGLLGSLAQVRQLTSGQLRGLPLRLVLRPVQVNPDGVASTVYVVHVELRGDDLQQIQQLALDRARQEIEGARQIDELQQQYRALLAAPGDDEDDEEQAAVAAEFHPASPDDPKAQYEQAATDLKAAAAESCDRLKAVWADVYKAGRAAFGENLYAALELLKDDLKAKCQPASPPPPVGASAPAASPPPPPPAAEPEPRSEDEVTRETGPEPDELDGTDAAGDVHAGGGKQPDRPRVGRQLAEEVLKLCHAVDLSWNEVRAEHAEDLGLTPAPVFEQDAEAMVSLRSVLKVKVEEKEKRRRKPKAEAAGATAEGGAA